MRRVIHEAKQQRSRETAERIFDATRELMDGRDFESVSVHEICEASDVSRSSFYARFPSKEALLFALHERHRAWRMEKLAKQTAGLDWSTLSIGRVIRTCIALYVEDRRTLDPYIRSMGLAEIRHPEISEQRALIDHHTMAMIRDHLAERLELEAPSELKRLEFAIRSIAAIAQEATQPPQRFAERMGLAPDALVEELAILFCRYTGIEDEDATQER